MLQVLQVQSQRGVACETNALHVWIQFHGALRTRNAHITIYDATTWSWVNLVNPLKGRVTRFRLPQTLRAWLLTNLDHTLIISCTAKRSAESPHMPIGV